MTQAFLFQKTSIFPYESMCSLFETARQYRIYKLG